MYVLAYEYANDKQSRWRINSKHTYMNTAVRELWSSFGVHTYRSVKMRRRTQCTYGLGGENSYKQTVYQHKKKSFHSV